MAKKQATPALDVAEASGIEFQTHSYDHDPSVQSFGLEAAEKLGVAAERIFKTLVAAAGKELVVAVVPVQKQLDLKVVAVALRVKSVVMADVAQAERTTGYIKGGISPLGQKRALRTVIDVSAQTFETVFVSAGKRGLDIELAPNALAQLTNATFATIARGT